MTETIAARRRSFGPPASQAPALAVCVGAAKAGTSSLHSTLASHPEVAVTLVKETDFFLDDPRYAKGLQHYLREYFRPTPGTRVLFEADPIYMYVGKCIERIHAQRPDARIIVMLRHPADRAFSQYCYRMTYRRFHETFEEMCEREADRVRQGEAQRLEYGCLDRSRYAPQVRHILALFPREQVHFMVFERLLEDPSSELLRLQAWLGLTPLPLTLARENETRRQRSVALAKLLFHPRFRRLRGAVGKLFLRPALRRSVYRMAIEMNAASNAGADKPRLDGGLRERLMQNFEPDIRDLEAISGLDLRLWYSER